MRATTLALLAAAGLMAGGCATDDAAERDARDATERVRERAPEVGRDVEEAAPGDADGDGR